MFRWSHANRILCTWKTQGPRRLGETVFLTISVATLGILTLQLQEQKTGYARKPETHLIFIFSISVKALGLILANVYEWEGPARAASRLRLRMWWYCDLWHQPDSPANMWSWAHSASQGHWYKWEKEKNVAMCNHWDFGANVLPQCGQTYLD